MLHLVLRVVVAVIAPLIFLEQISKLNKQVFKIHIISLKADPKNRCNDSIHQFLRSICNTCAE